MVGRHKLKPPDEGRGWVGEHRSPSALQYDSDIPLFCAFTSFRGELKLLVSHYFKGSDNGR